jgi:hypothetical protein
MAGRAAEAEGRRGLAQAFSWFLKGLKQNSRQRTNKASRAGKSQREGGQGLAMSRRGPDESQRRPAGLQKQRAGEGWQRHFHGFLKGLKQTWVKTMFFRKSFLEKYKGGFSLVFKGF